MGIGEDYRKIVWKTQEENFDCEIYVRIVDDLTKE